MKAKVIEQKLKECLRECLESYNQDGSFKLTYDPKTNSATVIFENIAVVEEDDYAGFQGY